MRKGDDELITVNPARRGGGGETACHEDADQSS